VSQFDGVQRATLAALADVVIPAGEGMPSASQADVAGQWLDAALAALPEVSAPLLALVDEASSEDPAAAIARLKANNPLGFDLLCSVVAGAYFLNPEVRRAIGYPGQERVPIVPENPPDYEQDGLLASVIARGPVYRPTPAPVST
jgi:hypothetical protein